jgi:putative phage-type endonuclease
VKHHSYGQGTPDWLTWRLGGLGGSDAPSIMGVSPYATRAELLAEKITGERRETNFAMRRGNRLEPIARGLYALQRGVPVEPACVSHDEYPWMLSSLDGLLLDVVRGMMIAEIKAWKWQNHDQVLAGLVPAEVFPQIQHQLMTTGLDVCDLVSYSEKADYSEEERFAVLEVKVDAEYQAELFDAEVEFWAEVQAGREARRSGKRHTADVQGGA